MRGSGDSTRAARTSSRNRALPAACCIAWNAPSDDCAGPGGPASVAFMTDYRFSYGPRLLSGEGATRHLGELLPDGPCLFVTDARILSLGLASAALEALEAAGVTAVIFDAIEQDPSDRKSTRLNSSH